MWRRKMHLWAYTVNIMAPNRQDIYIPWWCYCHWGGSGPVWLSSFPLVWFHWNTDINSFNGQVKQLKSDRTTKQEEYSQFCHIFQDHVWNAELRARFGEDIHSKITAYVKTQRILTKSSKPSRVPTISLSVFMTMWIREPIHLSTSSERWKTEWD